MPKEVIMPALGMAQDEGVLLRWLKEEGEMVQAGEPLMEVATDKVDVQVEAPASGLLTAVTAQEGDEIPVGQLIALIAAEGEELPAKPVSAPLATDMEDSEGEPPAQSVPSQSRVPSPVAARMAAQHGIDLADVPAVGGRISREDIEAHMRAAGAGVRVLASPKARRLARERGIDWRRWPATAHKARYWPPMCLWPSSPQPKASPNRSRYPPQPKDHRISRPSRVCGRSWPSA